MWREPSPTNILYGLYETKRLKIVYMKQEIERWRETITHSDDASCSLYSEEDE